MRTGKWRSIAARLTVPLTVALSFALALAPHPAYAAGTAADTAANCRAGTLVTVVAHLDDDLLFVDPGISEKLDAGWCITTVHLIGGANGAKFDYVLLRETGTRLAYSRIAGVANEWTESTVTFAGKPVHALVLKHQPRVRLLELRLPGGAVRGGKVPLGLLWDRGETLATYPMNADGTGATRYDRASLAATLRAILTPATEIYTLNPDTVPFIEHPDHIYAARITRVVAQSLGRDLPIAYHLTYPAASLPKNLSAAETLRKRDAVGSYFAIDGGDAGHVFGEYQWDGNWIARRYAQTARASDAGPAFRPRATRLVNEYSSQCLASGGSAGRSPRLAACSGSAAQDWIWQPLDATPGDKNAAQLVDAATRLCVAERDGGLVEEACRGADAAQRWTPWDFGLVYTPLGHCLGAKDGAVSIAGCSRLTAEYRWAISPESQWTDARQQGALYGDVKGEGRDSAVYVQRRKDGPGFNVWVAAMSRFENAAPWYLNAVPFDPHAPSPTCRADTLCFDSARFLVADFDGDGLADLMVIAPRNGGTAFWLLKSSGTRFEAPRLWYQTTSAWTPAATQQYVAADFDGDGRADVMLAQKRDGHGLNLWVLSARDTGGNPPALWLQAPSLGAGARFLAARAAGSARPGLFAIDGANGALAVVPLANTGSAFSIAGPPAVYPQFQRAFVKVTAGDLHSDGIDDLVVLQPRGESAGIDVWTIQGGKSAGAAIRVATLAGTSYADTLPALVRRDDRPTLMLFRRANAPLGDFYFTGGAPSLSGYVFDSPSRLGAVQIWGDLPGLFSEALWLEVLAQ